MKNIVLLIVSVFLLAGCPKTGLEVRQEDPTKTLEGISGVGIESQDIDRITEQMLKEILEQNLASYSGEVPRVIIDSKKIINESSQIINTSLFSDRIRIGLIRKSEGRLNFISRENSDAVIEEAKLSGQLNLIPADYRLNGRITSISSYSNESGVSTNFVQVTFELLDLRTAGIVWASLYDLKKVGADDTIYR